MPNIPSDCNVQIATLRFRDALNAIDRSVWGVRAAGFPAGCCDHCSVMLDRYLNRHFDIRPVRVFGEVINPDRSHRSSHVWLLWDGLTIDITGDQFGWGEVIVTRSSAPHDGVQDREFSAFDHDQRWWRDQCATIWANLMRHLGEHI